MFSEEEKGGENRGARFTHPATVVIELIHLDVQSSFLSVSVHTAFRLFQTIIFICRYTALRITETNYKRQINKSSLFMGLSTLNTHKINIMSSK
jgi:hypothetical protein